MPPKIIDEFTDLPVSKQRKAQLRHQRDGLCRKCGRPLSPHSTAHCERHYLSHRTRMRKEVGAKAWRPAKWGRPPADADYTPVVEEHDAVRAITNKAISQGILVKGPCHICGSTEDVETHHTDYSQPLKVVWLCQPHHTMLHQERLTLVKVEP